MHASWRMAVAERAAAAYAPNQRLAVFAAAGSVGTGRADRFSDLEVDCYWHEPPEDRDRLAPIEVLGGQFEGFWDYDADEEEWSEEYTLGALDVTISNFTVTTIERWLDAVTLRADTDPVKHMRLAAIQQCHPLVGAELAGGWRDRADRYPDELAGAMVLCRRRLPTRCRAGLAQGGARQAGAMRSRFMVSAGQRPARRAQRCAGDQPGLLRSTG